MNLKNVVNNIKNKYKKIKKDRVVFISYYGKFTDSPKYVYYEMKKMASDLEYIWLLNDDSSSKAPSDVKFLKYGSPEAQEAYNTACCIIDNVYGLNELYLHNNDLKSKIKFSFSTWLNDKKNQHLYSTWHGSPFKKMGIDIPGSDIKNFSRPNLTILLNDSYTLDIIKHLTFNNLKYKVMSSPRNDIFDNNEDVDTIKRQLKLPLDKKIVLFAPTFRAKKDTTDKDVKRSGINQLEMIDFDRLFETLQKKFGDDWVFVCRFHYHVSQCVNWSELETKYQGRVINGNLSEDMEKYLLCTDILLSDISSCLIDFSVTNRPSFLFFPDIDYYVEHERGGFYFDLESLPFPFAKTIEMLYDNISNFDEELYDKDLREFKEKIGFDYKPNSAKTMAKYILDDLNINC